MNQGHQKYRTIQNYLLKRGYLTHISKVGKKHFDMHINGVVEASYKQRRSCNNILLKLRNAHLSL